MHINVTVKKSQSFPSCFRYLQHSDKLKKATFSTYYVSSRRYSSTQSYSSSGDTSGECHPILRSPALQHKFKNWQHLRKNKLTASTFGLAVGFWPGGRVRLWLEKIGATEPFAGNLATCWNNIKEEEALERYKLITGNTVAYSNFHVGGTTSNEYDWLGASPDGVVDKYFYGLPSRGVLEIKCPFFGGDKNKSFPWKRVPMYYIPQAQGLMAILDCDWMDLYCWTINGSSLFRLYRDVQYWELLKTALSDFWWEHVLPARELCEISVITNPRVELKLLMPAPKHELHREIVYGSKLLSNDSKLMMREIHGKLYN